MTAAAAGTMIGRYRVVEGGEGDVVCVHDDRLDRDLVLKRIANAHALTATAFQSRFGAAARSLAALAHPGIVQIFDFGLDGDTPYLVMEPLAGPSLADELARRGTLPLAEVITIGTQIARALEAAHERRIFHRDVQPATIVRATEGHWKLVDFDLAHRPDSELGPPGRYVGAVAYAAPEALVQGWFSAASDVYGLAAALYQATTGDRPRGDLDEAALRAAASRPVLDADAIERLGELGPIFAAALALAPTARPTAAWMAELLAQSAPAAPTPATSTAPAPRPDPRPKFFLAVAGVVLLGALAVWQQVRPNDPPRAKPLEREAGAAPHAVPTGLDEPAAREWAAIVELARRGRAREVGSALDTFERAHGASAESASFRRWLEAQPVDRVDH